MMHCQQFWEGLAQIRSLLLILQRKVYKLVQRNASRRLLLLQLLNQFILKTWLLLNLQQWHFKHSAQLLTQAFMINTLNLVFT
jgi:hypothetical protein